MLKSDAARQFLTEVNTRFPSLPFSIRSFEDITKARLGVKHCLEHELLEPFEVHALKDGELAVSFTATIAIMEHGTAILAGNKDFNPELYKADKSIEDKELAELLTLSMDMKEQKKRSKTGKKGGEAEEAKS